MPITPKSNRCDFKLDSNAGLLGRIEFHQIWVPVHKDDVLSKQAGGLSKHLLGERVSAYNTNDYPKEWVNSQHKKASGMRQFKVLVNRFDLYKKQETQNGYKLIEGN